MAFRIAFYREANAVFLLYKKVFEKDDLYFTIYNHQSKALNIGSFLLEFLNTNIENKSTFKKYIYKYSFVVYYKEFFPILTDTPGTFKEYVFNKKIIKDVLDLVVENYHDQYIRTKNYFLEYLGLPFNELYEEELDEFFHDDIDPDIKKNLKLRESYMFSVSKHINDNIDAKYPPLQDNEMPVKEETMSLEPTEDELKYIDMLEFSQFFHDVSVDFNMFAYIYAGYTSFYKSNIPYAFQTNSLISILALELKEFKSNSHNTIRICQYCHKYYIPRNLKATKYCKNCRDIGKKATYQKNLSQNDVLKLYRKRYMSLASSVSHYGTKMAIERFEKYKTEGAIMKKKFLDKEITKREFKKWIENTKHENKEK